MPDWPRILNRDGPAVWRTAYRLLANHADADEVFQEALVDALKLSRSKDIRNWGGLLRRLATARSIDRLRQRSRSRIRQPVNGLDGLNLKAPLDSRSAEDTELSTRLRAALASIPAKQAQVFCLHALEEWSYQEIAVEMAISVNAVGALLHRARKRLQRQLRQNSEAPYSPGSSPRELTMPATARKDLP